MSPSLALEAFRACILAALPLQAAPAEAANPFDALLIRHAGDWSGAALVVRGGKTLLAGGYGFADFESNRSNDADTLFEIGEVTQAFTALAVARLAQQGKLALDDSISVPLAGVPEHSRAITLRQLLGHTSGIPGRNADGRGDDATLALVRYLGRGPQSKPGTRREYWAGGYALLAAAIEHAGGRPFSEWMSAEVLGPAGMRASGFTGDGSLAARSALGHSADDSVRYAFESPSGSYDYQERGIVGLVTSVRDLEAFDRALATHALLDEAHARELFTPVADEHALGWEVERAADGSPRLRCAGSGHGFAAEFRRLPERDACLVVLANDERAPVHEICANLECLALGRPLATPAPREGLSAEETAAIAGIYVSPAGRLVVRAAPGVLMAGLEGRELLTLAGAGEALPWKPDLAELERRAFEIVEGIARGNTAPLRAHVAARIAKSWPDTMRRLIWPAQIELHGAYRGARPVGSLARNGRVQVLLGLDHERGPAHALATFGPAGLESLDWTAPEFLATARLERVRRGTYRLLLGDERKLEFQLEGESAVSVRLEGRVFVRARDAER